MVWTGVAKPSQDMECPASRPIRDLEQVLGRWYRPLVQLTDGDRIRGLLGTYCRLIDAGDFARFAIGRAGVLEHHLTIDPTGSRP